MLDWSVKAGAGSWPLFAEEAVAGALDGGWTAVEKMGVEHRGCDVLVAQELLDGADVVAVLKEMGRERVAERMAGDALGDASRAGGAGNGGLKDSLVEVVTAKLMGERVPVAPGGGEHPLPEPVAAGVGKLPGESIWKFDPTAAGVEVAPMLVADPWKVLAEVR
jgi:hypothetical protein